MPTGAADASRSVAHDEQRAARAVVGAQRVLAQQLVEDLPRLRRTRLRPHDHVAGHDVIAVDEPQSARLQLAQRLGEWTAREAVLRPIESVGERRGDAGGRAARGES